MGHSNSSYKNLNYRNSRAEYDRLKHEKRLPIKPAIGRGMPTVVPFSEWDGSTAEEQEELKKEWDKIDQGRMGGGF